MNDAFWGVARLALVCCGVSCLCASAGQVIHVSPNGNGDGSASSSASLATALSLAKAGDDVVLEPGTYTTSTQLTVDEAVTVRGATGDPRDVVITLTGSTADHLLAVTDAGAVVSALTLQGGQGRANTTAAGYGRNTYISAGVVSNCVIRGAKLASPSSGYWTTSVGLDGSDAVMTHCVVSNNVVTGSDSSSNAKDTSAGVFVVNGRLSYTLVTRNIDTGRRDDRDTVMNDAGGVTLTGGSMDHCTVCFNEAPHVGGVRVNSPATASKCVIFANKSNYRAYGYDDIQPGTESMFADSVVTDLNPWTEFVDYAEENLRAQPGGTLAAADAGYAFAADAAPYVGIRVSSGLAIAPVEIAFSPSVAGIDGVTGYRWDFGDGSEEEDSGGGEVRHTYAEKGTRTVTLAVLGAEGAELGRATRTLTIQSPVVQAADYPSIQAAIDAAAPGCTIEIAPGSHEITAGLRIEKDVALRGATGNPEDVRLICRCADPTVYISDRDAGLAGVTIQDGAIKGTYIDGGAICVEHRGGTVSNCVFRNFTLSGNVGSGCKQTSVYLAGTCALMTHCVVTNITSTSLANSGATIRSVPGVCLEMDARLENSLIADVHAEGTKGQSQKWAAGVFATSGRLLNCTVVNTSAIFDTAGVYLAAGSATNCVIAGNASQVGADYNNVRPDTKARFFFCATDDETAVGATSVRGLPTEFFRDFANGDYTLTSGSPLKDRGVSKGAKVPAPAATDLAGNERVSGDEIDIGCYEFNVNAFTLDFSTPRADLPLPATVTFTAQVSGFAGTDEVWFYWDFDADGVTDLVTRDTFATHTYTAHGLVSVALAVTNKTTGVSGSSARADYLHLVPAVLYVDGASASPAYPYGSPGTAATNVQDAIDAAVDGVTVLVASGTYDCTSPVTVAKGVTVRGQTGNPADVVFDYVAGDRNFYLNHREAKVEAVTSQGGSGKGEAKSLLIDTLGGTVSNCIFRGYCANVGQLNAGDFANAISLKGEHALMTHAVVTGNAVYGVCRSTSPGAYSPGVVLYGNARIENSLVACNNHSLTNDDYIYHRGYAAGISGNGAIVNCTVVSNVSVQVAGVNFSAAEQGKDDITSGELVNTVVAGNVCVIPDYFRERMALYNRDCGEPDNATSKVRARSRNCVFGGDMATLFTAPERGVFRPKSAGPLRDAGTLDGVAAPGVDLAGRNRVTGRGIDVGAYECPAGLFIMVK